MKKLLAHYSSPPRKMALSAIYTICAQQKHIQAVLSEPYIKNALNQEEYYLATELVYGYIRYAIRIEALLKNILVSYEKLPKACLLAIGLSIYEILYMDNYSESSIVFHTVEVLKKRYGASLAGVANGVLRRVIRERIALLNKEYFCIKKTYSKQEAEALHYALPLYFWKKLCIYYPEHAEYYAQCLLQRPKNPIIYTCTKNILYNAGIKKYALHMQYLQQFFQKKTSVTIRQYEKINPTAIQVFSALGIERIEGNIWDCCSGRGGKRIALEAFGIIPNVVSDISYARLQRNNVHSSTLKICTDVSMPPFKQESFACIIADVPCSGTGTFRKRPDAKLHKTEENICQLVGVQKKILDAIAPIVKPQGYIVYITCSMCREENEEQTQAFLARHSSFHLVQEYTQKPDADMDDLFYGALLQKR